MKQNWLIRKYKEGDEKQILDIFNFVFKESRKLEHWYWKFRENPAGFAPICVAEDNGKIVGYYPLTLVKMKIEGETMMGSQMVDLVVHLNYQRQGIFVTLGKKLLTKAGEEGIQISYGFPNEAAHPGHLKYGCFDVGLIPKMVKILNLDHILKKHTKSEFLFKAGRIFVNLVLKILFKSKRFSDSTNIVVNEIPSFDSRINNFWERISADYKISIVRDQSYLNWRYVENPGRKYTIYLAENDNNILGFIILTVIEGKVRIGHIVDILTVFDQKSVARCLISKSIEYFRREKANMICCYILDDRYCKILKEAGFRPRPSELLLIARANSPSISKTLLSDPKNWHITFGDSDGI